MVDDEEINPNIHEAIACKYYLPHEFDLNFINHKQSFSLFHTNARSLAKKHQYLNLLLSSLTIHFSVTGITETWLSDNSSPIYNISDYSLIRSDRQSGRGGGVAMYISNLFSYKIRPDLAFNNNFIDSKSVEINLHNTKNIIVCTVNRPPNTNVDLILEDLNILSERINHENKDVYLMGDFNIDLLNSDNNYYNTFVNILQANSFIGAIDKPTRMTENTSTLIDNIFTNVVTEHMNAGLIMISCLVQNKRKYQCLVNLKQKIYYLLIMI